MRLRRVRRGARRFRKAAGQGFAIALRPIGNRSPADSARCSAIAISRGHLGKRDLSGADFTRAFLIGANLEGTNLTGAVLFASNLSKAPARAKPAAGRSAWCAAARRRSHRRRSSWMPTEGSSPCRACPASCSMSRSKRAASRCRCRMTALRASRHRRRIHRFLLMLLRRNTAACPRPSAQKLAGADLGVRRGSPRRQSGRCCTDRRGDGEQVHFHRAGISKADAQRQRLGSSFSHISTSRWP